MAYKKYIKRNGKVYGPYIYHSKRVGGKVVSEYRGGLKKPRKYFNLLLIFGFLIVIGFFIFFLVSSEKFFSGQAVLGLDADYQEGDLIVVLPGSHTVASQITLNGFNEVHIDFNPGAQW